MSSLEMPTVGRKVSTRPRKAKFSVEASSILVELVVPRFDFLPGEKSRRVSRQAKTKVWDEIAAQVSAVSTVKRSGEDCKKRWYDIKKSVRAKYLNAKSEARKTGGGECVDIEYSPAELRVMETMDSASLDGVGGVESTADDMDIADSEHHTAYDEDSMSAIVPVDDPEEGRSTDATSILLTVDPSTATIWSPSEAQMQADLFQTDHVYCSVPEFADQQLSLEDSFYAADEPMHSTVCDTPRTSRSPPPPTDLQPVRTGNAVGLTPEAQRLIRTVGSAELALHTQEQLLVANEQQAANTERLAKASNARNRAMRNLKASQHNDMLNLNITLDKIADRQLTLIEIARTSAESMQAFAESISNALQRLADCKEHQRCNTQTAVALNPTTLPAAAQGMQSNGQPLHVAHSSRAGTAGLHRPPPPTKQN